MGAARKKCAKRTEFGLPADRDAATRDGRIRLPTKMAGGAVTGTFIDSIRGWRDAP
jgi:hypothetical protein